MAFGAGLYLMGIFGTLLLMLLQFVLHRVLTGYDSSFIGEIIVQADASFDAEAAVHEVLEPYILTTQKSRIKKLENGKLEYRIAFKTIKEIHPNDLAKILTKYPEFITIEL